MVTSFGVIGCYKLKMGCKRNISRVLVNCLVFLMFVEKGLMLNSTIKDHCPNTKTSLNSVRKRRHLTFPDGTTLSVTTSVVKTFMTHVPSGWYLVIEGDLVYHLPDAKVIVAHARRKLHHRQKREFWETLQGAFDLRNMDGRACVIRSICEARTHLAYPGRSLVHDILRALFTAPLHEDEFQEEMGVTYQELQDPDVCEKANGCPFSVLQFILDLNKH